MTVLARQASPLRGTPLGDEAAGLDLCVHCGFCMQACPTYLVLEDENDSPRGRVMLMKGAVEGDLAIDDPALSTHLDRCLGCRACETACPSGVPYGQLLEAARATTARAGAGHRSLVASALLLTMRSPFLRRIAFRLALILRATRLTRALARLPGRAGFAFAMVESTRPVFASDGTARQASAGGRDTVATLRGCVMEGLFAHTNRATERVLSRSGYRLVPAPGQDCCGALHAHGGDLVAARSLAMRNIAAFEASGATWVAVNAAGCGAMMKEYGHLLRDDADWAGRAQRFSACVRDVTELVAASGAVPPGRLDVRVAYDAPCHLHHAQRVVDAPLAVMLRVDGLDLVPLPDADRCCGGAGIYNLSQPEISQAVLHPKLEHVRDAGIALVATGNPGCHMQVGAGLLVRGMTARCVHPADLLDRAWAGEA